MQHRTTIGLDLAKFIIQVCKVSKHGEVIMNKAMSPQKLKEFLRNSKPCVVAMEGCGSFHYWARFAQECGHTVKGMPPKKVKPYVTKQKTDENDALGIAVAAVQTNMTFCQIKTVEQQGIQSIQTSRKHLDHSITSLGNHIRALCYEYGLTINKGKKALKETVNDFISPDSELLTEQIKQLLTTLWQQYKTLTQCYEQTTRQLKSLTNQHEPCQRLMKLEGVGYIGAAALVNCLGDGKGFKNGRAAAVYAGVTPKQASSGGKTIMLGIDKHGGDKILKTTLYQGALAVISRLPLEPKTAKQQWLINLVRRAGIKRACVAFMNKTIRTAWAMLKNGSEYKVQPLLVN